MSIIEDHSQTENDSDLTPLRAHYLKKSLVQLQFARELDLLASTDVPGVSNLSLLGPPFSSIPKALVSSLPPGLDMPFLKYIFRQFVLTFPFMDAAPKNFYSEKVQPFVDAMVARNIASTSSSSLLSDDFDAQAAQTARKKMISKIEKNMALFVGSATKIVEKEEVVRLTQADLDRLERLRVKRMKRMKKNKHYFEVNIVGVRTVVDKGRMRSRAHEEFIIRTRRSQYHDVYVSRRYGDFRTLANELSKRYPDEDIPPPPAKDRSYVTAPATTPTSPSYSDQIYDGVASGFSSAASYLYGDDAPASPSSAYSTSSQSPHPGKLAREKNRLTLRSYLNTLLSSYTIASSPVLKSFLLSGHITLTPDELEDARRREEADRVREEGRKRFAREIAGRVDGLREAVKSVKGDIMGPGGLTNIFSTIKVTPHLKNLPENYKAVVEWARISLASTVFHMFVASDDASQTFAGLKRIHGLMPYMLLKGALKITNPVAMIRSVLDLFLAQPFGNKSLLQRMFTSSLTEEVRQLQSEIELVQEKVDDPIICQKIKMFVDAPREIQAMFKNDAVEEFGPRPGGGGNEEDNKARARMGLLVVILRSAEEPGLNRAQMNRIARNWRAWCEWNKERRAKRAAAAASSKDASPLGGDDSDDEDAPQHEDVWFFEDLRVLMGLYQQLRDKEQLIALIFEGFTADLLKDIITIFYSPLAQVYRAASIADSLSDFQAFINDLIKTVEAVEELSQTDPARTVQAFISLIQRHEQSFYNFVHKVHSKGMGLFDSLMRWIELFLTVIREGLGQPISLDFLLPHTGTQERREILEEVDQVALYHYKLKVLYEDKLRKRFGRASSAAASSNSDGYGGSGVGREADAEDEAARALVEGVIGEISFGELVKGDAMDLAAEEDEESSEEESSEYETGSEDESETESEETTTDEGMDGNGKERGKPLPSAPPGQQHQQKQHGRHQSASVPYAIRTQHHRVSGSISSLRSPGGYSAVSSPTHSSHSAQRAHQHHHLHHHQNAQQQQQEPKRKRSLSLRSIKSVSSLLGRDKDRETDREKDVPPLPPLPPSVLNQPGGGRVSMDQSQAGRLRTPVDTLPPPSPFSSYASSGPNPNDPPSSSSSARSYAAPSPPPSLQRNSTFDSVDSFATAPSGLPSRSSSFVADGQAQAQTPTPLLGTPLTPEAQHAAQLGAAAFGTPTPAPALDGEAPPVPPKTSHPDSDDVGSTIASPMFPLTTTTGTGIQPSLSTTSAGSTGTVVPSPSAVSFSSLTIPGSADVAGVSAARLGGRSGKAPAAISEGPGATVPKNDDAVAKETTVKLKQRTNLVQPPELKRIPALLPIFVEMMRPNLVLRKRTL